MPRGVSLKFVLCILVSGSLKIQRIFADPQIKFHKISAGLSLKIERFWPNSSGKHSTGLKANLHSPACGKTVKKVISAFNGGDPKVTLFF